MAGEHSVGLCAAEVGGEAGADAAEECLQRAVNKSEVGWERGQRQGCREANGGRPEWGGEWPGWCRHRCC
jgi:hypothetical protein